MCLPAEEKVSDKAIALAEVATKQIAVSYTHLQDGRRKIRHL